MPEWAKPSSGSTSRRGAATFLIVPVTGRSLSFDAHGNLKVKEPLEAYEHANPMSAGAEMALVGVGIALLAGLGYLLYSKSFRDRVDAARRHLGTRETTLLLLAGPVALRLPELPGEEPSLGGGDQRG